MSDFESARAALVKAEEQALQGETRSAAALTEVAYAFITLAKEAPQKDPTPPTTGITYHVSGLTSGGVEKLKRMGELNGFTVTP